MKVLDVKYLKDYRIHVIFEDGIEGDVQLNDLVQLGVFQVLKKQELFAKVYSTGYSIAWSDDLEIDANSIYSELSGKDPATAFITQPAYATN